MICNMCKLDRPDSAYVKRPNGKRRNACCDTCKILYASICTAYTGTTDRRALAAAASRKRQEYQRQHIGGW